VGLIHVVEIRVIDSATPIVINVLIINVMGHSVIRLGSLRIGICQHLDLSFFFRKFFLFLFSFLLDLSFFFGFLKIRISQN
jgi:hypothetical protein